MTKQEEIRKGIAIIFHNIERRRLKFTEPNSPFNIEWGQLSWAFKEKYKEMADEVRIFEDSQGVVIKVDRELPRNPYFDTHSHEYLMKLSDEDYSIELGKKYKYLNAQRDMLKADYVAVEPLIEEVK